MKILVTGTKGQVSRCLQERAAGREDVEVVAVGRPELDLLKPEAIGEVVASYMPDIVVSAAAYTAVDRAEDERDIVFAVNEIGAGVVAAAARDAGAPVIHLSTDYVFSGEADRPYLEDDVPDPKNVYGASKLAGEHAVAIANERHVILRTAWVYSPFGKNFVTTMLRLAETHDEIAVVDDQLGNPTSAFDIAQAIMHISIIILASEKPSHFGKFHLSGRGSTQWCGFAEKIFEISNVRNGPYAVVKPVSSSAYPTKAKRPKNSCLENQKMYSEFSFCMPEWQLPLEDLILFQIGNWK